MHYIHNNVGSCLASVSRSTHGWTFLDPMLIYNKKMPYYIVNIYAQILLWQLGADAFRDSLRRRRNIVDHPNLFAWLLKDSLNDGEMIHTIQRKRTQSAEQKNSKYSINTSNAFVPFAMCACELSQFIWRDKEQLWTKCCFFFDSFIATLTYSTQNIPNHLHAMDREAKDDGEIVCRSGGANPLENPVESTSSE